MNDRDAVLREVLDRLTPPLPAYPADWEDVLQRARARRRIGVLLSVAVAGAVALALAVTTPWSGGPSIVDRARAALTPPPGSVLHVEWTDTYTEPGVGPITSRTELWLDSHGRYHGFVDGVEVGGTHDLRRSVQYNPALDAIGPGLVTNMYYVFGDPVAYIRKQLSAGAATADGEATIDGRAVKRIRLRLVGDDCKPVVYYLFVDPKTYDPVEYRVTIFLPNRVPLVRRFRTYERLPATPANVRLTDIRSAHPTAKVYPPSPYRMGGPACGSPPGS